MKILASPTELGAGRVCLAIGVFDGVHLGHQQVIRQTVGDAVQREARSVVVTFDRHPNAVVAPARLPRMIQTLPQRLRSLAALGPDAALVLGFNEALSRVPAEDFVRGLARDFGTVLSICVGGNFTFGYRRGGNVELLRQFGKELHFQVHGLAAVSLDQEAVSSTRIREAISQGQLERASQMLGRPYALCGEVVAGDKLGRKLGFPTANLDVAGLALPPSGVYAAHARVEPGAGGHSYRSVVNIGVRPTLSETAPQVRVEAYLLGFQGDLYGQELELSFVSKLREEQKFESLEALRAQIARDTERAETIFSGAGAEGVGGLASGQL